MDGLAAVGKIAGVIVVHNGGADGGDAALQQDVYDGASRRAVKGRVCKQTVEQCVNGAGILQDPFCFFGCVLHDAGLLKYGLTWVKKMAAAHWLDTLEPLSHMMPGKSM